MAKAPTPGTTPKARARKAKEHSEDEAVPRRVGLRMKVRGEERTLILADLGPAATRLYRNKIGGSLMAVLRTFGSTEWDIDRICEMWWLARATQGEPDLAYETVEAEFPTYDEMLRLGAVEAHHVFLDDDDEDGSPEA